MGSGQSGLARAYGKLLTAPPEAPSLSPKLAKKNSGKMDHGSTFLAPGLPFAGARGSRSSRGDNDACRDRSILERGRGGGEEGRQGCLLQQPAAQRDRAVACKIPRSLSGDP